MVHMLTPLTYVCKRPIWNTTVLMSSSSFEFMNNSSFKIQPIRSAKGGEMGL